MDIRFHPSSSIPMYGNTVEALHLEIDGKHYVVAGGDGDNYAGIRMPRLMPVEKYEATREGR